MPAVVVVFPLDGIDGVSSMQNPILRLFVILLLTGTTVASSTQTKTATLVEAQGVPRCSGLDCPPWPVPDDVNVCVLADNTYYTGTYQPWGLPWIKTGKKLLELRGQSVEIAV